MNIKQLFEIVCYYKILHKKSPCVKKEQEKMTVHVKGQETITNKRLK